MKYNQHFSKILYTFIIPITLAFGCGSAQQSAESPADTADTLIAVNSSEEKKPEDKSKRPSPPATAEMKVKDLTIKIDYSQPAVKGRNIFGEVVPYGEVWRTGANEATAISFDKDVTIEGKNLSAGTYALFTIPDEKEWTIIFNTKVNQWGAFEYKKEEDVLRINVKPSVGKEVTERVTFSINEEGQVSLQWDKTKIVFKVNAG